MPTLMETTLKFDCTRLEDQVLLNKEKDIQIDTRVTTLENKDAQIDTKITELEDKDTQLDTRVTTLEQATAYKPTELNLNTGIVALTYADEISLTTQGTIKSNKGTDQVIVDYKIPIVGSNGILIDKQANANKIEVKIDPTANLKCKSLTAEDVSGSVTQSTKLSYDGYITVTNPAGTRMFSIPWNYGGGSLLTDKSVKTLFGKSIFGSGKIDLYRHNICFTSTDQDKLVKIRFIVISSKNVVVDSLADLKTLLGNTFTYPVNGGTGDNKSVYEITETGYKAGATPYVLYDTVTAYPAGTWTDTVTTV